MLTRASFVSLSQLVLLSAILGAFSIIGRHHVWASCHFSRFMFGFSVCVYFPVGSLLIIMSYALFKECRSLSRNLVSVLAICDIGQGVVRSCVCCCCWYPFCMLTAVFAVSINTGIFFILQFTDGNCLVQALYGTSCVW